MKIIFSSFIFISIKFICLFSTAAVYAHVETDRVSFVAANIHLRFANKGSVENNQPWLIPGTLMGGEALPVEKGLDIQDMQLHGVWFRNNNDSYNIETRLSSHHEGVVVVENFLVNTFLSESITLSVGKMDASFSPNVSWHAYNDNFSEASLNAQVLFGGHFADTGLRADKKFNNFNVGVEIWNGDAWPAGSGKNGNEYAGDIYVYHKKEMANTTIKTGLWTYYGEAEQRNDARYAVGHSHGNVSSNSADFFFSGREKLSGAYVNLQWLFAENKILGLNSEFIQRQSEGEVNDITRLAGLNSKHTGYISSIFFKQNTMTYALRHEAMSFDNEVSGAAAEFLATDAGLVNDDFEPSRTHFSISKQMDAFTLRAEAVQDKSIQEDGISRFTASLIWQDRLWNHY